MSSAQHWSVVLATLAVVVPATACATAEAPSPRLCVTRYGFCPAAMLPLHYPCGCPHQLFGNVPGHVEHLDGQGTQADLQGWPDRDGGDPLTTLGPLLGPR